MQAAEATLHIHRSREAEDCSLRMSAQSSLPEGKTRAFYDHYVYTMGVSIILTVKVCVFVYVCVCVCVHVCVQGDLKRTAEERQKLLVLMSKDALQVVWDASV